MKKTEKIMKSYMASMIALMLTLVGVIVWEISFPILGLIAFAIIRFGEPGNPRSKILTP